MFTKQIKQKWPIYERPADNFQVDWDVFWIKWPILLWNSAVFEEFDGSLGESEIFFGKFSIYPLIDFFQTKHRFYREKYQFFRKKQKNKKNRRKERKIWKKKEKMEKHKEKWTKKGKYS